MQYVHGEKAITRRYSVIELHDKRSPCAKPRAALFSVTRSVTLSVTRSAVLSAAGTGEAARVSDCIFRSETEGAARRRAQNVRGGGRR